MPTRGLHPSQGVDIGRGEAELRPTQPPSGCRFSKAQQRSNFFRICCEPERRSLELPFLVSLPRHRGQNQTTSARRTPAEAGKASVQPRTPLLPGAFHACCLGSNSSLVQTAPELPFRLCSGQSEARGTSTLIKLLVPGSHGRRPGFSAARGAPGRINGELNGGAALLGGAVYQDGTRSRGPKSRGVTATAGCLPPKRLEYVERGHGTRTHITHALMAEHNCQLRSSTEARGCLHRERRRASPIPFQLSPPRSPPRGTLG